MLILPDFLFGQRIDNTASFRSIDADRIVRLHYENDLLGGTDYYYSQGIQVEVVHPWVNRFFLSKLLISGGDYVQRGMAAEHNGFTPTRTDSDAVLYGDRPYAATLTFRTFSISRHDSLRCRITSAFSFGVIGPAAGGDAMQSTLHQWNGNAPPKGWQNQVQNDVVLNYMVGLEKTLIGLPRNFMLTGFATGYVGTLNTRFSTGMMFMAGKLNSRISFVLLGTTAGRQKFSFHVYGQPMVNVVGYDATLQGGLFNQSSPYTIAAGDLERITFQVNMGVVVQAGPVCLEYFYTYLSSEFNTGLTHAWGGVRVGGRW